MRAWRGEFWPFSSKISGPIPGLQTLCGYLSPKLMVAASLAFATPALADPKYEATIVRTTFGIPHIKAKTMGGLGFGAAYAEAEHNICLMAENYATVAGERSKFFGHNENTYIGIRSGTNLESDIYYRTMTDISALRKSFLVASTDQRSMIDGWVAGYNRFLKDNAGKLPEPCAGKPWVRSIGRDDALRSINAFSMIVSSVMLAPQIANAAPPTGQSAQAAVAVESDMESSLLSPGSNGWAFGGDATTNGRGLVVHNPHFAWFGANRFYQMQLTIPGKLNVAGVAMMNQPYILMGFNQDLAWTLTVDTAPHMALFRLALDPADATSYLVDGKREAMIRRTITVETRDGPLIRRTVYSSRYGPLVSIPQGGLEWTASTAYAVMDINNSSLRGGDNWIGLAMARSVREVNDVLGRELGAPFMNTLAADRRGDALYANVSAIPYLSAGRFDDCAEIPARVPGMAQRPLILDGSRSACGLENAPGTPHAGLRPATELPVLFRRDFVQNSNDSYRLTNPKVSWRDYGPLLNQDQNATPDPRTRMAIREIERVLIDRKFDLDLAAQTMLSNKSLGAEIALPSILKLCHLPTAPADACAALSMWDGKAELDSRGASLFNLFWALILDRPDVWAVKFDPADPVDTPRTLVTTGNVGDELLAALRQAADILKERGEPLDAPLRLVQFAKHGKERIPISGASAGGVLNLTIQLPSPEGMEVQYGPSFVNVVTFNDHGPVARSLLAYSQSSDASSPHSADQTLAFSAKHLRHFPFSDAEIKADQIGPALTIRN
jgi:acyl-homoserine-lactone acylase